MVYAHGDTHADARAHAEAHADAHAHARAQPQLAHGCKCDGREGAKRVG